MSWPGTILYAPLAGAKVMHEINWHEREGVPFGYALPVLLYLPNAMLILPRCHPLECTEMPIEIRQIIESDHKAYLCNRVIALYQKSAGMNDSNASNKGHKGIASGVLEEPRKR